MSSQSECEGGANPYVEGGTSVRPGSIAVPGQLPPPAESRRELPSYPRGEEVRFVVPGMRSDHKYKVTVGYLVDDTDPILQDWVRPPEGDSEKEEAVVLTTAQTLELRAGTYAYDIWEFTAAGERVRMIACGGFKLFRTVGGNTLDEEEVFNGEFDAQEPGG